MKLRQFSGLPANLKMSFTVILKQLDGGKESQSIIEKPWKCSKNGFIKILISVSTQNYLEAIRKHARENEELEKEEKKKKKKKKCE